MIQSEDIKILLSEKGVKRLHIVEKSHDCVLLMGIYNDREILIAIYQGTRSIYSKIAPAEYVPVSYWHCGYLDYIPLGLYAFANNKEELIEKIVSKIKRLSQAQYTGVYI